MFAIAVTAIAAAAFYVPGFRACHGDFPVPLDDVFIHFDFARAACRGHPFSWIAGQGPSSGETSPLYAFVLAIGYAIGFRGASLAYFSGAVACASIASAIFSVREIVTPSKSPNAIPFVAAALVVSVGALDFALFSGMEIALFVALAARAFVLAKRLLRAPPHLRASKQWRLGALGALLVWTRPEAAVIVFVLAVLAARHARSQSPFGALVRVASPAALATLAIAALNFATTGDAASAGARLKLLSSNPYLSDLDRAREIVLNLLHFEWRVMESSAAAFPRAVWLLYFLALAPFASKKTRELGAAILASAILWTLLVSFNGAARYQGFRYYAPAVFLLLVAIALGLVAIAERSKCVAIALGALVAIGAAGRAKYQARFFADASENIHDQQIVVGKRLRELARDSHPSSRVLLGDAGAIPYFSDLSAIDALGLGGFEKMSFTRAALSGEPSTLELLQHLAPHERPQFLALYPNWFPFITSHFGDEIARVTIEHNVICGGPTKIIARARWNAPDGDRAPDGVLDEIDVADVDSERAHDYESPAPHGGFAIAAIVNDVFDGGRIIPEGERESFSANVTAPRVAIVLRSDAAIDARASAAGELDFEPSPKRNGWFESRTQPFAIARGERIVISARHPLRDFHIWIVAR